MVLGNEKKEKFPLLIPKFSARLDFKVLQALDLFLGLYFIWHFWKVKDCICGLIGIQHLNVIENISIYKYFFHIIDTTHSDDKHF